MENNATAQNTDPAGSLRDRLTYSIKSTPFTELDPALKIPEGAYHCLALNFPKAAEAISKYMDYVLPKPLELEDYHIARMSDNQKSNWLDRPEIEKWKYIDAIARDMHNINYKEISINIEPPKGNDMITQIKYNYFDNPNKSRS